MSTINSTGYAGALAGVASGRAFSAAAMGAMVARLQMASVNMLFESVQTAKQNTFENMGVLAEARKMLETAKELQAQAAVRGAAYEPAEMTAFRLAYGITFDNCGNDVLHNPREWETNIKNLESFIASTAAKAGCTALLSGLASASSTIAAHVKLNNILELLDSFHSAMQEKPKAPMALPPELKAFARDNGVFLQSDRLAGNTRGLDFHADIKALEAHVDKLAEKIATTSTFYAAMNTFGFSQEKQVVLEALRYLETSKEAQSNGSRMPLEMRLFCRKHGIDVDTFPSKRTRQENTAKLEDFIRNKCNALLLKQAAADSSILSLTLAATGASSEQKLLLDAVRFLEEARRLQEQARTKGATYETPEMTAFRKTHGIAFDETGNDTFHNTKEWNANINELESFVASQAAIVQDQVLSLELLLGGLGVRLAAAKSFLQG